MLVVVVAVRFVSVWVSRFFCDLVWERIEREIVWFFPPTRKWVPNRTAHCWRLLRAMPCYYWSFRDVPWRMRWVVNVVVTMMILLWWN